MENTLENKGFEKIITETKWVRWPWTIRIINNVLEVYTTDTVKDPKYFLGDVAELDKVLEDIE